MKNRPENVQNCALCGDKSDFIDLFRPHKNQNTMYFYGICAKCFAEPDFIDRIEAAYELAFEGVTLQ